MKRHDISEKGNGDSFVAENKWWWPHRVSKCCYVTVVDRAAKGGAYLLRVSVLDFVKFRFFFAGRADVEWISKCLSDVWRWSSRKVCKSGP